MLLYKAALSAMFAVAGVAWAAQNSTVLEMSADGEIRIAPDGHVTDYKLKSTLSPTIAALVDRNVRSWRFEPIVVDGNPVAAKTALHLGLKAEPTGSEDKYTIRIADVRFGEPQRNARIRPPRYPEEAVRAGLGARVLLYVHLDETGKVVEASPRQTNLNARPSSEVEAKHWRDLFEKASISAAKNWKYDLSETINGKPIGTTAIVPLVFSVKNGPIRNAGSGEWQAYLPGPVRPAPWLKPEQLAGNADLSSLRDGQSLSLNSRFRLVSSVIGNAL
jgi:hypothetical protein